MARAHELQQGRFWLAPSPPPALLCVREYPFLDNSLLRELEGVVYRRETVSRRLGTARVRGERDGDG